MVAFNFQERFAALVESGTKTQTIRQTKRAKKGDLLQLVLAPLGSKGTSRPGKRGQISMVNLSLTRFSQSLKIRTRFGDRRMGIEFWQLAERLPRRRRCSP
jgi:hypothetical protein